MVAKVRRSSGNVFRDLGFDEDEAAHLPRFAEAIRRHLARRRLGPDDL